MNSTVLNKPAGSVVSLLVIAATIFAVARVSAATIAWTNIAGGNWNVAANWSPNQLRGASDVAEITAPGTYTVTLNISPTIAGLLVGGASGTQTLAQAANTLTVHGAAQINTNGQYNLNGGTYGGTNVTHIVGRMNWNAGSLATSASLSIVPGATLFMDGTSAKSANGSITNGGTMIWTNTGNFTPVSVVHNLPGGLFEIRNDDLVDFVGGSPVFINEGVIRKTFGAGTTSWQVPLVNRGDIETQTGVQSMSGAGSQFNDGTRFLGAGVFTITTTATFGGTVHSENLRITGGSHSGTNVFTGLVQWQGGTFGAASGPTIATNSTLALSGTLAKNVSGVLTNFGLITWTGSGAFTIVGAVHNRSGAVLDIQTDGLVNFIGGSPVFYNEGLVRKNVGAGTNSWQVPMVNRGEIEAQAGTIALTAAATRLEDGTQLTGTGIVILSGGGTLSGAIYSETLRLTSGTFSGTNVLSGAVRWEGGTLSASSAMTVATNSVLSLVGATAKTVNGALTNAGMLTWADAGNFAIVGIVHNAATGTFLIQTDDFVDFVGGSPRFINDGTIRKVAGPGNTAWQVPLVNRGVVDVQMGTMTLAGGSEFQNGASFIGAGIVALNTGTITLSGSIFSQNLQLSGATLTGSGQFVGSLDWLSGTIAAALDLSIPTNGILNLRSTGAKTINGTITNAGTILWEGTGDLRIVGVLHNLPGALFEVRNDELFDFIGGSPIVVNQGTLRKVAGTNTTTSQLPLINSGRVEILSGTLFASAGFTNQGGAVQLGGGRLQLPAGRTLALQAGSLSGHGTLIAHLLNNGEVLPATNGTLTISGNYTQALSGTLAFELGGLIAGVNHSQFVVTNRAHLSGRIQARLVNGFVPGVGNTFQVMTFATNNGDFVCRDGFLILGQDRRLQTQFAATSLTLTTVAAPDPAGPSLGIQSVASNVVVYWPSEFAGYFMQANTNLNTTNWTTLGTNSFLIIPIEGSVPQRYFRLLSP